MAGPDNQVSPVPTPAAAPTPLCPHCRQPLVNVGWLINTEVGLATIYHNELYCMVTINCQFIQIQQEPQRIALPSAYQPRGRG